MIVAGFGFRSSATVESLKEALSRTESVVRPTLFATATAKVDSPAFQAFVESAGMKVIAVGAEDLAVQTTITQSAASRAAHGTGSVAEAAALAAAGTNARLIAPRVISADGKATCAIAKGEVT